MDDFKIKGFNFWVLPLVSLFYYNFLFQPGYDFLYHHGVIDSSIDSYSYPNATDDEIIDFQNRLKNRLKPFGSEDSLIIDVKVDRRNQREEHNYTFFFTIGSEDRPCDEFGDRYMFSPYSGLRGIMNKEGRFPSMKCLDVADK